VNQQITVPYYNLTHTTQPVTRTHELREVLRDGARSEGGEAVGWYGEAVVPRYVAARRHLRARVAAPGRAVLHWRSIVTAIRRALNATLSVAFDRRRSGYYTPWLQLW